jgi:AcrR family transcriptional regulator
MTSTERGPSTLRERKKRATRERLLEVAQQAFAERGYDETTFDEIAARADVSRATVFNYFPRKDAFLFAWVERRRAAVADLLAREQEGSIDTPARLEHALMTLCEMIEADADTNRSLTRAFVQAGGQLLPGASDTAEIFAQTIRFGQKSGDIRADLDPQEAGRVVLDVYFGALARWAADGSASLRDPLRTAIDVVLTGLVPAKGTRRGARGARRAPPRG